MAIANKVCTNYVARFTGNRLDPEASLGPGVMFFSKNNTGGIGEDLDAVPLVTSFLQMELFVELENEAQSDPFQDLSSGEMEERDTIKGDDTRDQCLLYTANQLAYQHRLFAFSLVICGKQARFIRRDREGAVVSAGIDCSQHQDFVVEFLQRFNQLTVEQRGFDPTAIPATPDETEMFESAVAKIRIESLKHTIGDKKTHPRFRLEVGGGKDGVSRYVIGRALDYNSGVMGRCTRGFVALDLSTRECVFLKDMWRPSVAGIEPEHIWYEKLVEAKVPYLVEFKHGSDVIPSTPPLDYHGTVTLDPATNGASSQQGLTSRLGCLFSSGKTLRAHVHYRLVQKELCRPLSDFTNSRHLASVVLDSLKGKLNRCRSDRPADITPCYPACLSTYDDASVFHRDVSFGNIMIGFDDKGWLNDWDLCRSVHVDKSLEGPRAVSGLLCVTAPVFLTVYRGLGSSCQPGCSRNLSRGIR